MSDPDLTDVLQPNPLYNDNNYALSRGLKATTILKKICHLNIHECAVHGAQNTKEIAIPMIPGHSNITDLFTKEFKSDSVFCKLVHFIWRESPASKGGVEPKYGGLLVL
jgi:hypothetical protein